MVYEQQHIKKITIIAAGSLLLAAAVVFGLMCNGGYSNTYHLQTASAIQDKNTTTSTTNNNTIQLSTKEVKEVYNWIDTRNGASNPTLKVFVNASNIIKIQNPTDTKHELIIDTGADVLPSSDDINPNSSGQLSFKPTTTGTFTYHCAYHPFTMKGTIQIASSSSSSSSKP
ncbi:MAG: cupredoxin domain-containing protein [Nitrososphaeraceae archaeon]